MFITTTTVVIVIFTITHFTFSFSHRESSSLSSSHLLFLLNLLEINRDSLQVEFGNVPLVMLMQS
jgi:hypothetical protein